MNRHVMTAVLVALTGLFMVAAPAQAAITIVNTANIVGDPSPGGISLTYNVQQAGSVLVVGSYVDNGSNALTTLDFGGDTEDGSIVGLRSSLFYYKNPNVGNITISNSAENGNTAGLIVWELAGVDLDATVDSVRGSNGIRAATTITTTNNNAFIFDVIGFNTTSTGGATVVPDNVDSVLTKLVDFDVNVAGGGGWMTAGTHAAGAAGLYNLGWTVTANGVDNLNELAFAFAPAVSIPAPAALPAGLMMLGALVMRRRK